MANHWTVEVGTLGIASSALDMVCVRLSAFSEDTARIFVTVLLLVSRMTIISVLVLVVKWVDLTTT